MKIQVRIRPGSRHHEGVGLVDGVYEVRVKARAIDGKANEAAVKLLAKYFSVAPSRVKILRGRTSKHKLISID